MVKRRYELTDFEWSIMEPLLPPARAEGLAATGNGFRVPLLSDLCSLPLVAVFAASFDDATQRSLHVVEAKARLDGSERGEAE